MPDEADSPAAPIPTRPEPLPKVTVGTVFDISREMALRLGLPFDGKGWTVQGQDSKGEVLLQRAHEIEINHEPERLSLETYGKALEERNRFAGKKRGSKKPVFFPELDAFLPHSGGRFMVRWFDGNSNPRRYWIEWPGHGHNKLWVSEKIVDELRTDPGAAVQKMEQLFSQSEDQAKEQVEKIRSAVKKTILPETPSPSSAVTPVPSAPPEEGTPALEEEQAPPSQPPLDTDDTEELPIPAPELRPAAGEQEEKTEPTQNIAATGLRLATGAATIPAAVTSGVPRTRKIRLAPSASVSPPTPSTQPSGEISRLRSLLSAQAKEIHIRAPSLERSRKRKTTRVPAASSEAPPPPEEAALDLKVTVGMDKAELMLRLETAAAIIQQRLQQIAVNKSRGSLAAPVTETPTIVPEERQQQTQQEQPIPPTETEGMAQQQQPPPAEVPPTEGVTVPPNATEQPPAESEEQLLAQLEQLQQIAGAVEAMADDEEVPAELLEALAAAIPSSKMPTLKESSQIPEVAIPTAATTSSTIPPTEMIEPTQTETPATETQTAPPPHSAATGAGAPIQREAPIKKPSGTGGRVQNLLRPLVLMSALGAAQQADRHQSEQPPDAFEQAVGDRGSSEEAERPAAPLPFETKPQSYAAADQGHETEDIPKTTGQRAEEMRTAGEEQKQTKETFSGTREEEPGAAASTEELGEQPTEETSPGTQQIPAATQAGASTKLQADQGKELAEERKRSALEEKVAKASATAVEKSPTGFMSRLTIPKLIWDIIEGCADSVGFFEFLGEVNIALVNDKYFKWKILPTLQLPSMGEASDAQIERAKRWATYAFLLLDVLIAILVVIIVISVIVLIAGAASLGGGASPPTPPPPS